MQFCLCSTVSAYACLTKGNDTLTLKLGRNGQLNNLKTLRHHILTKKEFAGHWRISLRTTTNLMRQGLPFYKVGRSVRIDRTTADKWMVKKHETGGGQ